MSSSLKTSGQGGAAGSSDSDLDRPRKRKTWWERNDINFVLAVFVLVFLLVVLWPSIFVTIDSGHRGVYYSLFFGGTDTNHVLGEGFHFKLPWDKIYDYDVRLQQVSYTYSVISNDGLVVDFKISARCQPRLQSLGHLQRDIGPDYVQKIVIPETQTALRQIVGDTPIDQIISTNVAILQRAVIKSVKEVSGKYIQIDDILITEITIPEILRKSIEAKLVQQQNSLQYDYVLAVTKKEAERKRIEAEGIRDFQRIVTPGISPNYLRWRGIEATLELAKSNNSKVIVIGAQNGLPLILDTSTPLPETNASRVPLQPSPTPSPPVSPQTNPSPSVNPGILGPELVPSPSPAPRLQILNNP
jgi:regulator of protease activity HflC (stomatin/prohibitin superfamily)